MMAVTILACAGGTDPVPATYRGTMSTSNDFDLGGEIIFTIAENGDVLGNLNDNFSPNSGRWELRGELDRQKFVGRLSQGGTYFDVDGSMLGSGSRIDCNLNFDDGDITDNVTFSVDRL